MGIRRRRAHDRDDEGHEVVQSGARPCREPGPGVGFTGRTAWTTDDRTLNRGNMLALGVGGLLKEAFDSVGCETALSDPHWDVRELGSTVALRRPKSLYLGCGVDTDASSRVSISAWTWGGSTFELAPVPAQPFGGVDFRLVLRPHPRTETILMGNYSYDGSTVKYLDERSDPGGGAYQYLLAQLRGPTLSVTLKQLVVLAPTLTLQAWVQLFDAFQQNGPYWRAASDPAGIAPAMLVAVAPGADGWAASYDGHQTELNVNLVLRWEYRPGSLVYVVYSHSRHEAQPEGVYRGELDVAPQRLFEGPATDSFLVKRSYWWGA